MTTSTKNAEGVHPDKADKPDSPGDMKKSSWGYVLKRTLSEFSKDQCTDLAAALTYYAVLALFPALIALMSLVGLVGNPKDTATTLIDMLKTAGVSSKTIETTIMQLSSSTGAGLALIIGLATALWSASGYVGSFGRAMNRVYEINEGRPVWKLRPTMLLVTLVSVVLVAVVLVGLVVSGPAAEAVGDTIGLGSTALTVWNIAKWPVMLAIVVFIVALLYYATPNIKQPKFRWLSIGALIAIVVWVIASALFGFYVANFSSYNKTYGALAGVIVFLLWLWLTNIALLFGAELDAELERGRQLQAGVAAEESVQLPVKDDKNIKKTEKKHEKVVAQARALRESRGDSQDPEKG
jgi:membrane protein